MKLKKSNYKIRVLSKAKLNNDLKSQIFELKKTHYHYSLKSQKNWILYAKNKLKGFKEKPQDIPSAPHSYLNYKDEWKGMGDWLGTGIRGSKDKDWRPFKEARAYVQKLNIKSSIKLKKCLHQ